MYDDFLARILEPDLFSASQFYGSGALSRQLEGEKRLMIAIFKDAIECLDKYRSARGGSGQVQYQNALEWVEDPGKEWLFSFSNICDLLGFDPEYIRKVLLKREGEFKKPGRPKLLDVVSDNRVRLSPAAS
jgi:hypothetical protein